MDAKKSKKKSRKKNVESKSMTDLKFWVRNLPNDEQNAIYRIVTALRGPDIKSDHGKAQIYSKITQSIKERYTLPLRCVFFADTKAPTRKQIKHRTEELRILCYAITYNKKITLPKRRKFLGYKLNSLLKTKEGQEAIQKYYHCIYHLLEAWKELDTPIILTT